MQNTIKDVIIVCKPSNIFQYSSGVLELTDLKLSDILKQSGQTEITDFLLKYDDNAGDDNTIYMLDSNNIFNPASIMPVKQELQDVANHIYDANASWDIDVARFITKNSGRCKKKVEASQKLQNFVTFLDGTTDFNFYYGHSKTAATFTNKNLLKRCMGQMMLARIMTSHMTFSVSNKKTFSIGVVTSSNMIKLNNKILIDDAVDKLLNIKFRADVQKLFNLEFKQIINIETQMCEFAEDMLESCKIICNAVLLFERCSKIVKLVLTSKLININAEPFTITYFRPGGPPTSALTNIAPHVNNFKDGLMKFLLTKQSLYHKYSYAQTSDPLSAESNSYANMMTPIDSTTIPKFIAGCYTEDFEFCFGINAKFITGDANNIPAPKNSNHTLIKNGIGGNKDLFKVVVLLEEYAKELDDKIQELLSSYLNVSNFPGGKRTIKKRGGKKRRKIWSKRQNPFEII
jgi:hypothetical protein